MADNRGSSRRSSRRGPQRSKTSQRNVIGNSKSKPTSSRNRNRSIPRGRHVITPQSRVTSLPSDLWTLLLPFLTWRDTDAMLCVCCEWKKVVTEAKKSFPEWRSTVLGPSADGSESLELLSTNHLKWADTRFAPDLVLLSAASQDCSPWYSGGYWEEAIAAIEGAKLLPPTCKIVGLFTMNSVLGRPDEDEDVEGDPTGSSSAVTLSISIAHLPQTTLEMAEFDRKDLRRYHHGGGELENPFSSLEERDMPSFLMFGVNDQSARHLVPAVEQWYPGAAVVGAVTPLVDRCVPIATYSGGVEAQKSRKNRGAKQQTARRSRPRGQVAFPSTMLLRLHGKVGVKGFSSSGYHPITPVVRCERVSALDNFSQIMAYDFVSMVGQEEVEQHHIMDLLEPTERLAIGQEDRTLNIFSCREIAPLQHLSNSTESDLPVPTSARIERLEFVTPAWNRLVMSVPGLYWQEGAYGILASHHPTRTSHALTKVLQSAQAGLSSASERALGAFLVAGALNEVEDAVHAKEVSKLFVDTFRELQVGGCIVRISVGPVALPGGLQPPEGRNVAQVQAHTTCGAIFYTKA